ncbi:integrase core domain-containing protein [Vreelandella janggokensis]|uniref:Transposase n=1 Tax=Vreelandella janggokensis TaxID=370767 RepID=A0ABT4IQ22_9GAMM|nr:integrase core domain-containing protein [Halomonas janggokensis]MCZ0925749.1 transposase [Halomonas janggokensis]
MPQLLDELTQQCPLPDSIVYDNGPGLTSKALFFRESERKVTLALIQPSKPTQNALIESFNGKFWYSFNLHRFPCFIDARYETQCNEQAGRGKLPSVIT